MWRLRTSGLNPSIDSTSASYLVPTRIFEQLLSKYDSNTTFLGVQAHYPQLKVLLAGGDIGKGIAPFITKNMLRYEAPEQMRGAGKITVPNHEWTAKGYDQVTEASLPMQQQIMSRPGEWLARLKTTYEFLDVFKELYLNPRGIKDNNVDSVVSHLRGLPQDRSAAEYRNISEDLSNQYLSPLL